MIIYLVASTLLEIEPFVQYCQKNYTQISSSIFKTNKHQIHILIHGVGMLQATYHLTNICKTKPDLIIQAGVAGALDRNLQLGEVVEVYTDRVVDIGAMDDENFISAFEMNLMEANSFPFYAEILENKSTFFNLPKDLKKVNGITQNTASGNEIAILKLQKRYPTAQTESMEGVCLHYVCAEEKINFLQIRAISNYVEKRNRTNWQMPLAIKNLNEILVYISTIN